jgi:DNA-binding helix-hairpin-helix protein with protein kinase domain
LAALVHRHIVHTLAWIHANMHERTATQVGRRTIVVGGTLVPVDWEDWSSGVDTSSHGTDSSLERRTAARRQRHIRARHAATVQQQGLGLGPGGRRSVQGAEGQAALERAAQDELQQGELLKAAHTTSPVCNQAANST